MRTTISIHALLAESDVDQRCKFSWDNGFLSTLSLRRATVVLHIVGGAGKFLSTLSLRRATNSAYGALDGASISIHALLAESDGNESGEHTDNGNFYPRSPCGERPSWYACSMAHTANFYPRSPCGERQNNKKPLTIRPYFYPRSPCGERQQAEFSARS